MIGPHVMYIILLERRDMYKLCVEAPTLQAAKVWAHNEAADYIENTNLEPAHTYDNNVSSVRQASDKEAAYELIEVIVTEDGKTKDRA